MIGGALLHAAMRASATARPAAARNPSESPAIQAFPNQGEISDFFDGFFAREMVRWHIPGAAFVLVKDGKVVEQLIGARPYGERAKVLDAHTSVSAQ